MATGRITKRAVDALVAAPAKQFLWDDDLKGFGLQVTPAGAKSYVFQYRTGGREASKKRYTIGRHGSPWTPDTARTECKRLALMVAQGIDPADMDNERRRQAVDLAFTPYIETFTTGYLSDNWVDWKSAAALLRREPADVLKRKPLPQITRADMVAVFDRLRDRPATARLAHSILRKMFRWAEGRGEIEQGKSPLGAAFPAPQPVAARERTLSDLELSAVWSAATQLPYPFGPLYRLLIATGQRREEVGGLPWNELDRQSRIWELPAARAKNGNANVVHLNDLAMDALDEVAAIGSDPDGEVRWPRSGFVFTTTGRTAVSGYSKAKKALDDKVAALSASESEPDSRWVMPPWRLHDLRRTIATGFQRLGIRFEVTEAVLNHRERARGGIAGVYQRHDWRDEKRGALDAWARHIGQLYPDAMSENVVPISQSVAA